MDLRFSWVPAPRPSLSLSISQTLLFSFTAYLLARLLCSRKTKGNLPPGPRGLPLLGNVFQIPQFQWLQYTAWKEEFGIVLLSLQYRVLNLSMFIGPIFSLNFAGNPVVVLNSHEVATDLLGGLFSFLCIAAANVLPFMHRPPLFNL